MSKVQKIEAELVKLAPSELKEIRAFLDEMLEDEQEFTPDFEEQIRHSEQAMAAGQRPRTRQTPPMP